MGDSGLWGHVRLEVTPRDASDCLRALSGGPVSLRLNIDVTTAISMRVPRSSVIIATTGVCWICSWRCVRHHLTSAFDSADGTASQVTRVRVVDVKDYRMPALMKPREHSINYLVRVSNYPIAPPLLNPGFMQTEILKACVILKSACLSGCMATSAPSMSLKLGSYLQGGAPAPPEPKRRT